MIIEILMHNRITKMKNFVVILFEGEYNVK